MYAVTASLSMPELAHAEDDGLERGIEQAGDAVGAFGDERVPRLIERECGLTRVEQARLDHPEDLEQLRDGEFEVLADPEVEFSDEHEPLIDKLLRQFRARHFGGEPRQQFHDLDERRLEPARAVDPVLDEGLPVVFEDRDRSGRVVHARLEHHEHVAQMAGEFVEVDAVQAARRVEHVVEVEDFGGCPVASEQLFRGLGDRVAKFLGDRHAPVVRDTFHDVFAAVSNRESANGCSDPDADLMILSTHPVLGSVQMPIMSCANLSAVGHQSAPSLRRSLRPGSRTRSAA